MNWLNRLLAFFRRLLDKFSEAPKQPAPVETPKQPAPVSDRPVEPRVVPAPVIVDVGSETFKGRFDADSLSTAEAAYVYAFTHTQAGSALAGKVYWQSGIFSGSDDAINRLINRGELAWNAMHLNAYSTVDKWPDGPLKRAVTSL